MKRTMLDFAWEALATLCAALCALHLAARLPLLVGFPVVFTPLLAIPPLLILAAGYLLPFLLFAAIPLGAVWLFFHFDALPFALPALLLLASGAVFRKLKALRRIPVCLAATVAASVAGVFWDSGARFWNREPESFADRAVSRAMILSLTSPATTDAAPNLLVFTDSPGLFRRGFGRMTLLPPGAPVRIDGEEADRSGFRISPDGCHLILMDFHLRKTLNDHALVHPDAFEDRARLLRENGVLAMRLPNSRESAALLASARKAFRHVLPIPLDGRFYMLCSNGPDRPETEPDVLNEKAAALGLYRSGRFPPDLVSIMLNLEADREYPPDWLEDSFRLHGDAGSAPPLALAEADEDERVNAESRLFRRFGYWLFALMALAWLFARYFVSWKTFHKQVFRAFENLFFLSGVLTLATFLASENPSNGMRGFEPWMASALCAATLLLKRFPERESAPWRRLIPVAAAAICLALLFFPIGRPAALAVLAGLALVLGEQVRGACAEPADLYLPVNAGALFGGMFGIALFPLFALEPFGLAIWGGLLVLMRVLRCFA